MKNKYYKYRELYIKGSKRIQQFTESIFKNAEIWFAAPIDLNDPFDCNMRLHFNGSTDNDWVEYIDDIISQFPSLKKRLEMVKSQKKWSTTPGISDVGANQHKNHYVDSSLFCLSKKNNSVPMFSYYADGHSGIAIEFSFSDQEVPCGFSYNLSGEIGVSNEGMLVFADVNYMPTFPELNFHRIRKTDKLIPHLIFTKSKEWEHEEEFRIFRRNIAKSSVPFDRKLITRIIFGCKTTNVEVEIVKDWLKNWPSKIVLSKAVPSTDRFELQINDFDMVGCG
jgi:hypothetical protein